MASDEELTLEELNATIADAFEEENNEIEELVDLDQYLYSIRDVLYSSTSSPVIRNIVVSATEDSITKAAHQADENQSSPRAARSRSTPDSAAVMKSIAQRRRNQLHSSAARLYQGKTKGADESVEVAEVAVEDTPVEDIKFSHISRIYRNQRGPDVSRRRKSVSAPRTTLSSDVLGKKLEHAAITALRPGSTREELMKRPRSAEEDIIIQQFLRNTTTFKRMDGEYLELLVRVMTCRQYDANQVVFVQGTTGLEWFVVLQGKLEVIWEDPESKQRKIVYEYTDGENFGEIALSNDMPRAATVATRVPTTLAVVHKDDYNRIIAELKEIELKGRTWFLEQFSLFATLNEQSMFHIGNVAQSVTFSKGDLIQEQDVPVNTLFFIKSGRVRAYKKFACGPDNVLYPAKSIGDGTCASHPPRKHVLVDPPVELGRYQFGTWFPPHNGGVTPSDTNLCYFADSEKVELVTVSSASLLNRVSVVTRRELADNYRVMELPPDSVFQAKWQEQRGAARWQKTKDAVTRETLYQRDLERYYIKRQGYRAAQRPSPQRPLPPTPVKDVGALLWRTSSKNVSLTPLKKQQKTRRSSKARLT